MILVGLIVGGIAAVGAARSEVGGIIVVAIALTFAVLAPPAIVGSQLGDNVQVIFPLVLLCVIGAGLGSTVALAQDAEHPMLAYFLALGVSVFLLGGGLLYAPEDGPVYVERNQTEYARPSDLAQRAGFSSFDVGYECRDRDPCRWTVTSDAAGDIARQLVRDNYLLVGLALCFPLVAVAIRVVRSSGHWESDPWRVAEVASPLFVVLAGPAILATVFQLSSDEHGRSQLEALYRNPVAIGSGIAVVVIAVAGILGRAKAPRSKSLAAAVLFSMAVACATTVWMIAQLPTLLAGGWVVSILFAVAVWKYAETVGP